MGVTDLFPILREIEVSHKGIESGAAVLSRAHWLEEGD